MEREKQIEEIYQEILTAEQEFLGKPVLNVEKYVAEHLYNADYRKERQGEWITDKYTEAIYCSVCSGIAPVDCEKERFYQSDYCPNCGAKMFKEN